MFFRRFNELREVHDLKQKQVASYLGIHANVYRRYDKGCRNFPMDILLKLADYCHVSTDYLLGRTDNPSPPPPAEGK